MYRNALILALTLSCAPGAALSASSAWFETDGVRVRLMAEDTPAADGTIRGALAIDLQPGWKTYWKDPGDAGIPPQVDIGPSTNISSATVGFPAPQRFDTGGLHWAGYKEPIDLPVTFKVGDPSLYSAIDVDVFLGVCEEICIPVQTRLSVTLDPQGGSSSVDAARVEAAFARLPGAASSEFGVSDFRIDGDHIVASATLPKDATEAELFVVTPIGWKLGAPVADANSSAFRVPILARPADGALAALDYTLATPGGAVEGTTTAR